MYCAEMAVGLLVLVLVLVSTLVCRSTVDPCGVIGQISNRPLIFLLSSWGPCPLGLQVAGCHGQGGSAGSSKAGPAPGSPLLGKVLAWPEQEVLAHQNANYCIYVHYRRACPLYEMSLQDSLRPHIWQQRPFVPVHIQLSRPQELPSIQTLRVTLPASTHTDHCSLWPDPCRARCKVNINTTSLRPRPV